MKSRTQVWIVGGCLLAATVVTIGLRARSTTSHSSRQSFRRATEFQAQPHLSTVALRSVTVAPPMVLGSGVPHVLHAAPAKKPRQNPDLPTVEEFVLTPPNPALKIYKTQLSVRFPGLAAEGLAAVMPLTLGNQNVVLRRSADDPAVFTAAVDFDWKTFAKEQQQRKDLANTGREIPVFEGHQFVRMDTIHFVEPDEIRNAVQTHQSIQFTPQILEATGFTIQPAQELMIVAPSVVEDPARTWDPCTSVGTPRGAWTFGTLMTALANGQTDPRAMVENWLNNWTNNNLVINTFKVNPRPGMASKVLSTWPRLAGKLDLVNAPMRLNAIVNRIDLGQTGGSPTGGELRFIFGVTSPCPHGVGHGGEATPELFDIIFEYNVPAAGCNQILNWANQWHALDNDPNYNRDLQAITDQVVTMSAGASTNLNRIRTNETYLSDSTTPPGQGWEMREFFLSSGVLHETTMGETPQGDPYGTDWNALTCTPSTPTCNATLLTAWINLNQNIITFPGFYTIPNSFGTQPFLGASAFQPVNPPGSMWWNTNFQVYGANTRATFSANTCNACHGLETATANEQVVNRVKGQQATLSGFLVGCNGNNLGGGGPHDCSLNPVCPLNAPCVERIVAPPDDGTFETWGDILRRAGVMSNILNGCSSDGLLQGLVLHRISFVH
jgi:hypothetical protein